MQPRSEPHPEPARDPRIRAAAVAAVLYALALGASILTAGPSLAVSTIWFASGVGLVVVLTWGYWLLPLLCVVHVGVSYAVPALPLDARLALAVVSIAEIGLAAWLLRRGRETDALFDLAGTIRFGWACMLVAPVAGAVAAPGVAWWLGLIPMEDLLWQARNWWLASAAGMMCITPLVNGWVVHGRPRFHGQIQHAFAVLGALLAPSGIILVYQLGQQRPAEAVFYAALPIVLWSAVFLRETGAAAAIAILAALALCVDFAVASGTMPAWNVAAHIVAFGLVSLLIANAQSRLERAIAARARQQHLEELAYRDPLTGLANRHRLARTLEDKLSRWRTDGRPFAVLMTDLDGFKAVNDRHGHDAGDEVLRVVARRLVDNHKEGDLVARLGGDEFVIVLDPCPDLETAVAVGSRAAECIARPMVLGQGECPGVASGVGLSVGVVHVNSGAETAQDLLKQADRALYRSKRSGKGRALAYACDEVDARA